MRYSRRLKQLQAERGSHCAWDPNTIHDVGVGLECGPRGVVVGSAENDGAAMWYCASPGDGENIGKCWFGCYSSSDKPPTENWLPFLEDEQARRQ